MRHDSSLRIIVIAIVLCLVCSVLVSSAAVALRPEQARNKVLEEQRNILIAADLYEPTDQREDILRKFESIERVLVDLETGLPVPPEEVDPNTYNPRSAAKDPNLNHPIAPGDLPGFNAREPYAFVYLVKEGDEVQTYVLPIYGKGLWASMYGYIALDKDLTTVGGITFYQHGETPGLGGEIDNPNWQAIWVGKEVFDAEGEPVLRVIKGNVNPDNPQAPHQVDALSGATLTTNGVTQAIRYWFGPEGFGPFLEQQRQSSAGGSDG